ncbi:DUF4013 domain-containing protein [Methanobrevibacter sp. OttesenSCG-928-K11]|nr:DUF4013 domain-containing protein [Methanobrevibacter sp. OttesenSCG-928-K11]MDL2270599.1 DUF4013 domain-containing protein [Methanobrevibacter sp. OttesenSCG-928-I08]
MSVTEIVKNSLNFPFTDTKKLLSLSGLVLIVGIVSSALVWGTIWSFSITHGKLSYLNGAMFVFESIIPLLLSFFVIGYIYRVFEGGINENGVLPDFNQWKKMFIDGAKLFILHLAYAIIPIILTIIGTFLIFDISFSSTTIINHVSVNPNDILNTLGGIFYIVAALIYIISLFFQIMAINHMISNEGDLSYGFKLRDILDKIKSIGYGKFIGAIIFATLISFIILFAFAFITSIIDVFLTFIPFIGPTIALIFTTIVITIVESYIYLFFARTCGLLYNE